MSDKPPLVKLVSEGSPASLGPARRADAKGKNEILEAVDSLPDFTRQKSDLVKALLLLWHDHIDESHEIAQAIHTPDGSYIHMIIHRREPDFSNCHYWLQRVGKHPAAGKIAAAVNDFLVGQHKPDLARKFAPGGSWDGLQFMRACEAAQHGSPETSLLKEVQRREFQALLESFL